MALTWTEVTLQWNTCRFSHLMLQSLVTLTYWTQITMTCFVFIHCYSIASLVTICQPNLHTQPYSLFKNWILFFLHFIDVWTVKMFTPNLHKSIMLKLGVKILIHTSMKHWKMYGNSILIITTFHNVFCISHLLT